MDGNVNVTSEVDAGPISVALFVPLPLFSKNSIKPAEVEPFFTDRLALCTLVCEKVTAPAAAIVIESASLAVPIVPPSLIRISSLNVTIPAEEIVIASSRTCYKDCDMYLWLFAKTEFANKTSRRSGI